MKPWKSPRIYICRYHLDNAISGFRITIECRCRKLNISKHFKVIITDVRGSKITQSVALFIIKDILTNN